MTGLYLGLGRSAWTADEQCVAGSVKQICVCETCSTTDHTRCPDVLSCHVVHKGVPRMNGRSTASRGSKPQAPQRKLAQHRAAGVRGAAPAGRVSTGGPAGRPRVSAAGGWRVDGGLRQPQMPPQQQQWRSSSPPGVDTRDSSEHSRWGLQKLQCQRVVPGDAFSLSIAMLNLAALHWS